MWFLMLLLAPLVQAIASIGYEHSRDRRPAFGGWSLALTATSAFVAVPYLAIAALVAPEVAGLDPSDCAALSKTEALVFGAGLVLALALVASQGAWVASRARRGAAVVAPLAGEVAALGLALFLQGWIGGGMSC